MMAVPVGHTLWEMKMLQHPDTLENRLVFKLVIANLGHLGKTGLIAFVWLIMV